ncbi:MAG: SCO family protein [Chloroflexi bacterium]|nr:SCO family protein [Chloroflexota bacterium]
MFPNRYGLFLLTTLFLGLILMSVSCLGAPQYEYKGTVFNPPVPLPDFELKDTNGQLFHLYQVKGDIALIYFGYTYCPDVCPLTMYDVKEALTGLKSGKERVHVIFVSIDPERDTPDILGRYVAAFGPEFKGLTDDFEKVKEVMKPYGAFAEKESASDSAAGYLVSHSARLYLVDPQAQLLLTYSFGFEAEDLRSDLEYVLQQRNS